jgi:hypothetical protein
MKTNRRNALLLTLLAALLLAGCKDLFHPEGPSNQDDNNSNGNSNHENGNGNGGSTTVPATSLVGTTWIATDYNGETHTIKFTSSTVNYSHISFMNGFREEFINTYAYSYYTGSSSLTIYYDSYGHDSQWPYYPDSPYSHGTIYFPEMNLTFYKQ